MKSQVSDSTVTSTLTTAVDEAKTGEDVDGDIGAGDGGSESSYYDDEEESEEEDEEKETESGPKTEEIIDITGNYQPMEKAEREA